MTNGLKNIIRGKKVTVMGLGLHGGGVESVKWLVRQNFSKILVTDLKTKKELSPSLNKLKKYKITYILGRHRIQDFKKTDLVIKNPGVPKGSFYLKIARKNKIPIETDISLFFRFWPGKIIGVTGTRGKSTIATLIYQILKKAGLPVFLAGNIGNSVLKFLDAKKDDRRSLRSIAVLELSSWQLEDAAHAKRSPEIAIIINMFPEHLNRYKNLKEYIKAKKYIFKFQKPSDYLILNRDNKITKNFAKESKVNVRWFDGQFQEANQNAAALAAKILKVSLKTINRTIKDFSGLEHRLEYFYTWLGVKFYNDSAATSPEATILAIKKFKNKNIILIAGGMDKNLNYKELAGYIKKFVKYLILLPGTASDKIKAHLDTKRPSGLWEAIKLVKRVARAGDIVLLSPAAASFNLFKNEFDRGRKFKKYVRRIFKKS